MSMYEKPVISVDTGMAEGVYAASGSSSSELSISNGDAVDWGNGNGQRKFSIDTTKVEDGKTTITLQFNNTITNCWGGDANVSVSGQKATLTWYAMPKRTMEITAQANSNINSLEITGYEIS